MSGEYHNGDLQRLHERIDDLDGKFDEWVIDLSKDFREMSVSLGKLETAMNLQPGPRQRPCEQLKTHLETHKQSRQLWQRPLVGMIVHLFELALVAAVTLVIARALAGHGVKEDVTTAGQEITQQAAAQALHQGRIPAAGRND